MYINLYFVYSFYLSVWSAWATSPSYTCLYYVQHGAAICGTFTSWGELYVYFVSHIEYNKPAKQYLITLPWVDCLLRFILEHILLCLVWYLLRILLTDFQSTSLTSTHTDLSLEEIESSWFTVLFYKLLSQQCLKNQYRKPQLSPQQSTNSAFRKNYNI